MAETLKKDLIIEISAEGMEEVRRAFTTVSSSLNHLRKTGREGLADVNKGFVSVGSSAMKSFGVLKSIAGTLTTIGLSAAALTFVGAVGSAQTLLGIISQIRQTTEEAIASERELTQSAAIFGIKDRAGDLAALRFGALQYSMTSIGAAEADEVKDIVVPLIDTIQNALKKDEGAYDLLAGMGLSVDDIVTADGKMRDIVDIMSTLQARYAQNPDKDGFLNGLVAVFGDADAQKMARFLQLGPEKFAAIMEEYLRLRDLTALDQEISARLIRAMALEAVAMENLGTSIKRGFGGAFEEVTYQKTAFIEGIRSDLQSYAEVFGASYQRIMTRVFGEATRFTDLLKGASGTLVDGPLEGWLMAVENIMFSILETAIDFVEFFATGQTDNAFVLGTVKAFESVRDFIKEAIKQGKIFAKFFEKKVWPVLDSIGKFFGAENDWQTVGIIAGLILFSGTIVNVVRLGGTLISFFGKLLLAVKDVAGPVAGLVSSLGKIEGISSKMKGFGSKLGKLGLYGAAAAAGTGAAYAVVDDERMARNYASFVSNIENVLKKQGRTDAEIAAYLSIAIEKFKEEHGSSWLLGAMDLIPGLTSESDVLKQIQDTMKNADAAQIEGMNEARIQAISDFSDYSAETAVLNIGGVEFESGIQYQIDAAMEGVNATLPVNFTVEGALQNLMGQLPQSLTAQDGTRYFGAAGDVAVQSRENLTPINLFIEGESFAQVLVTDDTLREIQRTGQIDRRTSTR